MNGVATGPNNIHSVHIERRGKLVAELYRKVPDLPINVMFGIWRPFASDVDFGPTTLHDTRSISKSVVSLLVGIAIQQGKIKSVTTPVHDFYPGFAELRTRERNAITLEHPLTLAGMPGKTFHYNLRGTAVLADVLIRTSGKSLTEPVRTQLFEPLDITDWQWVADLHGRELAFAGLHMRPRDMLKLGRLVLDKGQWRGRQIVPAKWIAASTRRHVSTGFRSPPDASSSPQYGCQWWPGSTESTGRQVAWSAAFSNGGQRIFTVPEPDMTVVITAGDYGSAQRTQTVNRLFARVVSTVKE